MSSRLFWKFFFAFWLAVLVAGLSIGAAVQLRHTALLEQQQNTPIQINRHASALISVAANIGQYGGREALQQFMLDQQAVARQPLLAVSSEGKDLLQRPVSSDMLQTAQTLLNEEGWPRPVRRVQLEDGQAYLLFIAQSAEAQQVMPRWGTQKRPLPTIGALLVAWTLAGVFFSAVLAWWFTQPIGTLRRAFSAFASGQLDTRVSGHMGKRRDELAQLGQQFDDMASQISLLIDAQRRLLHDVSHELRSPLARMQAAIGLAQQNPQQLGKTLERVERESQRIDLLVGDLLNLSRLETGVDTRQAAQQIDVSRLLDEIVEDARLEAATKQIGIQLEAAEPVQCRLWPQLLHRAVENVLRNSLKYSDANSLVRVELFKQPQHLLIRISDQGPGVAAADLPRIFEPFFRASQQHQQHSSGLGLTIAQRSVQAMKGSISASNRSGGGLQVDIRLPLDNN